MGVAQTLKLYGLMKRSASPTPIERKDVSNTYSCFRLRTHHSDDPLVESFWLVDSARAKFGGINHSFNALNLFRNWEDGDVVLKTANISISADFAAKSSWK